jgi:hypothetical protein
MLSDLPEFSWEAQCTPICLVLGTRHRLSIASMSCPDGSRLALDLAEAKNASVLTDTHASEDEIPLRVREEERARAARRLAEIRMA